MKNLVFGLLIIVAVILIFFARDFAKNPNEKIVMTSNQDLQSEETLVDDKSKKLIVSLAQEGEETEEVNPYETEVFKGQVNLIADRYAETAKFPIGSQPIRNAADARQPKPYEETGVETPFETESGETVGVFAAVDRFQYFTNDTINVRLELSGVPNGDSVEADAVLSGTKGDTPLTIQLQAIDSSQSILTGAFDTSLAPPSVFSQEMIVKLTLRIGGEPFLTTVGFNYTSASARLVGLGLVKPNGANLEIPLEYTVFNEGYYFVNAILSDEKTGRPLIAIQTEGRMSQGNGRLIAQAHILALKESGSEGPYILKNIKAHRGAERGEKFDIPAATIKPQFTVSGYSFSEYLDEEYQDPLAQERIDFLKNLGQTNNDNNQQTSEK